MDDTKRCSKCGVEKLLTDFSINRHMRSGRSSQCKVCCRDYARHLRATGRVQESDRRRSLKKLYGITLEEWEQMYDEQLGRCAVCFIPLAECKIIATDHDHKTGAVRGLLCSKCNLILGQWNDDPEIFRRAAQYLGQVGDHESLTIVVGGEL